MIFRRNAEAECFEKNSVDFQKKAFRVFRYFTVKRAQKNKNKHGSPFALSVRCRVFCYILFEYGRNFAQSVFVRIKFLLPVLFRQSDGENSLHISAFYAHFALVKLNDTLYYRKTYTVSLPGVRLVRLVEFTKNARLCVR